MPTLHKIAALKRRMIELWRILYSAAIGRRFARLFANRRRGRSSLSSSRQRGQIVASHGCMSGADRAAHERRFVDPTRGQGVCLIGHPFLIAGRGEDLRSTANAFSISRIPFDLCNAFGRGQGGAFQLRGFHHFDRLTVRSSRRANLFVLNADEMAPAAKHLGSEWFSGAVRIGYWAWELSRFPDAWLNAFDFVDEIWAPSRFIQQAVAERTNKPVVRIPLVIEPARNAGNRARFALPVDMFLFLFFFDFSSFLARKNPFAVIAALRRAFPRKETTEVGVVVKLNGGHLRPEDYKEFKRSAADWGHGVFIIDEVLSDSELGALINSCDAFVSLHRSEGFGRGPAEAMYFGKPVITTGYSGNLDYCNSLNCWLVDYRLVPVQAGEYPQSDCQVWADPDVDQAAAHMREIVSRPEEVRKRVARARETILSHHSAAAVGALARERLIAIGALD
jgi:glycosyltransferase involved in cell wall biosynthesis